MHPNGTPFILNPSAPEPPTIFAHARIAPPSPTHHTLYISGIAPIDPVTGVVTGATQNPDGSYTLDIRAQTAAVLRHIDTIIQGATGGKGDIRNVIDAVVYILDMKTQYAGMNEEWNKVFPDRMRAPARATVGVRELPDERFGVEVKAVALCEGMSIST